MVTLVLDPSWLAVVAQAEDTATMRGSLKAAEVPATLLVVVAAGLGLTLLQHQEAAELVPRVREGQAVHRVPWVGGAQAVVQLVPQGLDRDHLTPIQVMVFRPISQALASFMVRVVDLIDPPLPIQVLVAGPKDTLQLLVATVWSSSAMR